MSRRLRVSALPPATGSIALWAQQVTDALNLLPNFSISSTSNGPNSTITGNAGVLLIDIGSSNTTFWGKATEGGMTGWQEIISAATPYNIQHARATSGSIGAGLSSRVTITWAKPFADTAYTVQALAEDPTASSLADTVVHLESYTSAAVGIRVLNNSLSASTSTIHVLGIHD